MSTSNAWYRYPYKQCTYEKCANLRKDATIKMTKSNTHAGVSKYAKKSHSLNGTVVYCVSEQTWLEQ